MHTSSYDKRPAVTVPGGTGAAWAGWEAVGAELRAAIERRATGGARVVLAVECSTGLLPEVRERLRAALAPATWIDTVDALRPEAEVQRLCAPWLGGDDPLFGVLAPLTIDAFLDPARVDALRRRAASAASPIVVFGTGATRCCAPDLLVHADLPRWEGQLRQRRGVVSNLGIANAGRPASLQYKRGYFIDWRVTDRVKQQALPHQDYLLDSTREGEPRLVTGDALRRGLDHLAQRPFRFVPLFDPAPWGGQWMRAVCDLPADAANYGWCFDCVPEENSLLLRFGDVTVEIPGLDLVFYRARELLGAGIVERFGAEFPIRFDFLDTMGGGNLSLQVHPIAAYMREHFGHHYTQDESYYLLDAGPGAAVHLGLRDDVDPRAMLDELAAAQRGGPAFAAERHVARWPARRHDHFLIPAGTVHGSGADAMVLEVSATPYIFTFKLWDWGRPGLDGLPRPVNLERGAANIQWDRRASWVRRELIGRVRAIASGDGWREERTGLHELQFIETRRHWFTGTAPHDTAETVHVLNLVQGDEVVVESPDGCFEPFVVHYAETFVVPAAVGRYTVRPHGRAVGTECATLRASVRGT
ncbi:MAG: class I mannose-6-phosphate isomerase [Planctomycetes bacterium]|nr:class I mannose-6-phosphate isomerase [Planctomycetota bacterium]